MSLKGHKKQKVFVRILLNSNAILIVASIMLIGTSLCTFAAASPQDNFHNFGVSIKSATQNHNALTLADNTTNNNPNNWLNGKLHDLLIGFAGNRKISMYDALNRLLEPKKLFGASLRYYDIEPPYWVARTDFSIKVIKGNKTTFEIETIQPLYQTNATKRNTVFAQARVAHRRDDKTANLGVGYRYLMYDESWLFGGNIFYDTTYEAWHNRLGLGAEAMSNYVTFRANCYKGISKEKSTVIASGIVSREKAIDGYDLSIELPLPKLPWANIRFDYFKWKSNAVANVYGHSISLDLNLAKNLRLELGKSIDNSDKNIMHAKLSFNFGTNPSFEYNAYNNIVSDEIIVGKDLYMHTLDKVKHRNDMVIEKIQTGDSGTILGRGI